MAFFWVPSPLRVKVTGLWPFGADRMGEECAIKHLSPTLPASTSRRLVTLPLIGGGHFKAIMRTAAIDRIRLPIFATQSIVSFMSTMNISLPESLKHFVDEQIQSQNYGTCSEYVRELIRKEKERQHLRQLLLKGAESEPTTPSDDQYFSTLRSRITTAAT